MSTGAQRNQSEFPRVSRADAADARRSLAGMIGSRLAGVVFVGLIAALVAGPTSPAARSDRTCGGKSATLVGTNGSERLVGTDRDDVIGALDGDDAVLAHDGDDIVCAGDGGDAVRGGEDKDRILGADGTDILDGEAGRDIVEGDWGRDVLRGGNRADGLFGRRGADEMSGGPGPDACRGGRPSPDRRPRDTEVFPGDPHRGADVAFPECDRRFSAIRGHHPQL